MNVANSLSISDVQGTSLMGVKMNTAENTGLSAMFSLEMGTALLNFQSQDLLQMVPQNVSAEDMDQLEDLLAMLQQMLSSGMNQVSQFQTQDELDGVGQDSIPAVMNQVADKLSTLLDNAKGTQIQITNVQAMELKNSLENLIPTNEATESPELKQMAAQVSQMLEKYRNQNESGKKILSKVTNATAISVLGQKQNASSVLSQAIQGGTIEGTNQVKNLQVKQAISMYQTETGTMTRGAARKVEQTPVTVPTLLEGQAQTDPSSSPITNVQTVIPTSTQPTFASEMAGRMGSYSVRAEQFTQDVTNIFVKQMKLGNVQGISEAKLILHPQSLGQVDVTIQSQNGMITAYFSTDSKSGKELLDNQIFQLRQALVQQGLQVDKIEVAHQQNNPNNNQFDFQQQRDQARQQPRQQQEQQKSDDEQTEFSIEKLTQSSESVTATMNRLKMKGSIDYSA